LAQALAKWAAPFGAAPVGLDNEPANNRYGRGRAAPFIRGTGVRFAWLPGGP